MFLDLQKKLKKEQYSEYYRSLVVYKQSNRKKNLKKKY